MQRVQAVDAGAQHVVARGLAQRLPGRDQFVVAGQGTVGDDVAFGFVARRHGGQAHLLGHGVGLEAPHLGGVEQAGMLGRARQRRARHAGAGQRLYVFALHVGRVGSEGQGAVGLVERLERAPLADVDVAQRQARVDVARLARHPALAGLERGLRLAGVGQRHDFAGLESRVPRMAAQPRAVGGQRLGPALQVAVGARGGQLHVGRRIGAGRQRFEGGRRLGGPAGPAGDDDVVVDGAWPGGGALPAQHLQRGLVVAGAGPGDQAVVILGGGGQRQGRRQDRTGGQQAQARRGVKAR